MGLTPIAYWFFTHAFQLLKETSTTFDTFSLYFWIVDVFIFKPLMLTFVVYVPQKT